MRRISGIREKILTACAVLRSHQREVHASSSQAKPGQISNSTRNGSPFFRSALACCAAHRLQHWQATTNSRDLMVKVWRLKPVGGSVRPRAQTPDFALGNGSAPLN